jgi:hypothetical protein
MPAPLYEILTREIQTKRKLAAVTLRELEPMSHNVLRASAVLPKGSLLREATGATWKVREVV